MTKRGKMTKRGSMKGKSMKRKSTRRGNRKNRRLVGGSRKGDKVQCLGAIYDISDRDMVGDTYRRAIC